MTREQIIAEIKSLVGAAIFDRNDTAKARVLELNRLLAKIIITEWEKI